MEIDVVTKAEIAERMSKKTGDTVANSKKALEAFMEVCKETLANDGVVALNGFMNISKRTSKGHDVTMPSGRVIHVPEKQFVRAIVSKTWRE